MSKKIICSLFILVFVFSGISYAKDNPFKGLTQDQVIQKYFEGRQLDTIEGIWVDSNLRAWIAIKSNLVDANNKYGDYDYLMIESSSSPNIYVDGLSKTQYASCFIFKGTNNVKIRFLSPNSLYYNLGGLSNSETYTRIYPNEVK